MGTVGFVCSASELERSVVMELKNGPGSIAGQGCDYFDISVLLSDSMAQSGMNAQGK